MKRNCKHEWVPLFTQPADSEGQIDYMLLVLLKNLDAFKYCPKCGRMGHSVHGRYIKAHSKADHTWLIKGRGKLINPQIQL